MIEFRDRFRMGLMFGTLAVPFVAVIVRLADLQLVQSAAAGARSIPLKTSSIPAQRGRILDRHGEELACDRPVYEVRAEIQAVPGLPGADPFARVDLEVLRAFKNRVVTDVLWALGKDSDRFQDPAARDAVRETLEKRVIRALERAVDSERAAIDFLIDRTLDDADAIAALRSLDRRSKSRVRDEAVTWRMFLHENVRFERVYAEPDHAAGVIGLVRDEPLVVDGQKVADRRPVSGLERLASLLPQQDGEHSRLVDALSRSMWIDRRREPQPGAEVRTTLDRSLQRRADVEVARAAEDVAAHYGSVPEWAGLVLVDVKTGGILAAASYTAANDGSRDRNGAFAPTQRLFPPGSVVKPLHVAMVLERGLLDWNETIDCRPGYLAGSDFVRPVPARRTIRDSHQNGPLPVSQVLIQSSNIGAIRIGLRLGPDGLDEYLQRYGFGAPSGAELPGELVGTVPSQIASQSVNEQYVFAGPSVLFGYQIQATILQVARAYLTFLSGQPRDLRLVEPEAGDQGVTSERFLSSATLDTVKSALVGVLEDEHGTARRVGAWIKKLRVDGYVDLEIAGKTGTSQYSSSKATRWDGEVVNGDVRTASFVGFTPVREPRFLAVCVVQKVGASSFYGGTYAAPAASRLLFEALVRASKESTARLDRSGSTRVAGGAEPGGSAILSRR
ncbi:MAG: penicillin-binding protein 2 [Planctomycetota bacterium]|nr:penicillin-binding protein 2 [Planctomycetota bacterium]